VLTWTQCDNVTAFLASEFVNYVQSAFRAIVLCLVRSGCDGWMTTVCYNVTHLEDDLYVDLQTGPGVMH